MKFFLNEKKYVSLLPILISLLVVIVIIVLLLILGFKITYAPYIDNNWDAISAIGQVLGALSTPIALWVALKKPQVHLDVDLRFEDSEDNETLATLYIFNLSQVAALITYIKIVVNDEEKKERELAYDSYNSIKDNFRDFSEPIFIAPYKNKMLEFSTTGLLFGIGHTIDAPTDKTSNNIVKLVIGVPLKEFTFNTNLSYEEYYRKSSIINSVENKILDEVAIDQIEIP